MKHVLCVVAMGSATGRYGGPFDVAISQVNLLRSWGYDAILASGFFEGDRAETPFVPAIQFPLLGRRLGTPAWFSFAAARQLFLSIWGADVVHIAFAREAVPLYALIVSSLLDKSIIIQPHGMLTVGNGRLSFLDPLFKHLLCKSDAIIALTETEAAQLKSKFPKLAPKVVVAGNPPETLRGCHERPLRSKPQVLFLARLHPRKRVADFISLARSASEDADFAIVGPDNGDLPQVLSAHHEGVVTYEGPLPGIDVPARISQADLLVLPAHDEPWSTTLVTAIHAGVPVLIHESAALAPTITRYGAGRTYNTAGPDMLRSLHKSLTSIDQMSYRCRELADSKFSSTAIAEQLENIYRDLTIERPLG